MRSLLTGLPDTPSLYPDSRAFFFGHGIFYGGSAFFYFLIFFLKKTLVRGSLCLSFFLFFSLFLCLSVCVSLNKQLNFLTNVGFWFGIIDDQLYVSRTESILTFRVNPPLDRPGVLTSGR